MPRWLGYSGLALAVLMLVSAFVAPLMVFGLWLVVSGVALSARPSRGKLAAPRPAPAVP
jgi:steroid 5-alpha reductase family enzyme